MSVQGEHQGAGEMCAAAADQSEAAAAAVVRGLHQGLAALGDDQCRMMTSFNAASAMHMGCV